MKHFLQEFRAFIMRGNVVDMAVGVIVGSALTAIVNSLTNNIINPLIVLITGGTTNISGLIVPGTSIDFGAFLGSVINFLIVCFILFCFITFINKLQEAGKNLGLDLMTEVPKEKEAHCPWCREQVQKEARVCPHCTRDIAEDTLLWL